MLGWYDASSSFLCVTDYPVPAHGINWTVYHDIMSEICHSSWVILVTNWIFLILVKYMYCRAQTTWEWGQNVLKYLIWLITGVRYIMGDAQLYSAAGYKSKITPLIPSTHPLECYSRLIYMYFCRIRKIQFLISMTQIEWQISLCNVLIDCAIDTMSPEWIVCYTKRSIYCDNDKDPKTCFCVMWSMSSF